MARYLLKLRKFANDESTYFNLPNGLPDEAELDAILRAAGVIE